LVNLIGVDLPNVTNIEFPNGISDLEIVNAFSDSNFSFGGSMEWFRERCETKNGFVVYNTVLVAIKTFGDIVSIPEGITAIGGCAFFESNGIGLDENEFTIGTLKIPSSVEEISSGAFHSTFYGTIEKIEIERAENSIPGGPWGALCINPMTGWGEVATPTQVVWTGTN